jgi:hypothetical protein
MLAATGLLVSRPLLAESHLFGESAHDSGAHPVAEIRSWHGFPDRESSKFTFTLARA